MTVEKVQSALDLGMIEHLQVPKRAGEVRVAPDRRERIVPGTKGEQGGRGGIDPGDLGGIAEEMNKLVAVFNSRVAFSIDRDTGRAIMKVIDNETGEVIRQIPPEEMLGLIKRMDKILGMLIDKKA